MIHVIFVHWEAFNTCVFNGVMEESEPASRFICGALFVLWLQLIPDSLSFTTWGSHFRRQRLMNGISTGCCRKWLCVTQQRQQLYLSCSTNWKMTDLPDSRKRRNYKLKIFAFGEEPTTVRIFYTSTLENTPKETLNKSTMILINESDSLLFLPLIIKVKTVKTWWISFSTSTLKIPLISLSPIKFSELFKKYQISCRELGCHLSFNSKGLCNPIFIKTDSKGMRGIFKLGMFWQGTSDFFCVINLGLSVVGLHILSRSFPAANSAFSCQVFDKMLKKRPN